MDTVGGGDSVPGPANGLKSLVVPEDQRDFILNTEMRKGIASCEIPWLGVSPHKMQPQLPHRSKLPRVFSLFGSCQVHFYGNPKPITSVGGLISFVEFLGKTRLPDAVHALVEAI
jgi:hypothetical protein